MATTTSGTTDFGLDVDDIIEQAFDPLGGEHTSSEDARKARRALNLILIELQNKNIPLSKIDYLPLTLSQGVAEYELPKYVSDVLQVTVKKSGQNTDIEVERYSLKQYHAIPNKTTAQRPTVFTTERNIDNVRIKFWPVPPDGTYTANLMVANRIEDITASYQKIDIPYRYLPLVIKWLSYSMSLVRQGIPADVRQQIFADYQAAMPDTFEEDRERSDFTIVPGGISGR